MNDTIKDIGMYILIYLLFGGILLGFMNLKPPSGRMWADDECRSKGGIYSDGGILGGGRCDFPPK